jgi:hypothetical protein
MSFLLDQQTLKPGLIIFRRADVGRLKANADRSKTVASVSLEVDLIKKLRNETVSYGRQAL